MRSCLLDRSTFAVSVLCLAMLATTGCFHSRQFNPPSQPASAGVSLSPSSLTFAIQLSGSTSAAQAINVRNTGSGVLDLSGITASGDFSQTNTCGSSVAPGAICAITVTFTPTASGARTGTLTLSDNALDSPQSAALSGTGGAPVAQLSASSLSFSSQGRNTTSAPQSITLTNSGNLPLNVAEIGVTGDFAETNTCGSKVDAGANCSIAVTFTPTATGARTGTLTIKDDAADSPQSVSLTGTGAAGQLSGACQDTGTGAFPSCFAVSSPTAITASSAAPSGSIRTLEMPAGQGQTQSSGFQTAFAAQTAQIQALLAGTDPAPAATVAKLGQKALQTSRLSPSAACFGPSMYYANHPEGSASSQFFPPTGALPGGDLGIWQAQEDSKQPDAGQVCAAAELNDLLTSASDNSQFALALAAEGTVLAGSGFPAKTGDSADITTALQNLLQAAQVPVTVGSFTIGFDGTSYLYSIDFTVTASNPPTVAHVRLTQTPGSSQYVFSGLLAYMFDDGVGVAAGTTLYQRSSQTNLSFSTRASMYPTGYTPTFASDGQLDPADTNWSGSFERFGASFDPTSPWLSGSYVFVLGHSPNDPIGEVFQATLGTDGTGKAFYGFGDQVSKSDSSTIQFMDCLRILNSTGPLYAQYQPFQFDPTSGLYVPSTGAQIRYAPTSTCTWTVSQWNSGDPTGLWYDRELQYPVTWNNSGQAQNQPPVPAKIDEEVVADPNSSTYPMNLFGDNTTPVQTLINQQGFTMPPMF